MQIITDSARPGPSSSTGPDLNVFGEAARKLSSITTSNTSLTDAFAEYSTVKDNLIKEKRENQRLTECLNHILNELNERVCGARRLILGADGGKTEEGLRSKQGSDYVA
jgi:hypothetical protein